MRLDFLSIMRPAVYWTFCHPNIQYYYQTMKFRNSWYYLVLQDRYPIEIPAHNRYTVLQDVQFAALLKE